jgi:hypothetical protein
MAVSRRLVLCLTLASAACGGTDGASPIASASPDAGGVPGVDGAVASADAAAAGNDAGTRPPVDAAVAPDSASPQADAAPPLVLEIPRSEVSCGGASCDTLESVCCSSWSKGVGFGSEESCVKREDCYRKYSRSGETNRAVTRECDGKEDCSGGQICCVYADGQPLFENFLDPTNLLGPGGSTICADEVDCTYNNQGTFVSQGIPLGEIECNDDDDCSDRDGTSCLPEQDGSHSTGAGITARAEVKVCR